MVGLSGSGKSTTADMLTQQANAIRLRSDAIRKHLAGVALHATGSDEIYTQAMTDRTYTRLIELGVRLASQGYRVILDAKFDRQAKRKEAIAQAQAHSISLAFLYCSAPEAVLKSRLDQRSGDIADATAAILAKQSMEPFGTEETLITIDTTQPKADIQQRLVSVFPA
ncbi:MAG: AAA family ATPase [Phormidesmis sp.]